MAQALNSLSCGSLQDAYKFPESVSKGFETSRGFEISPETHSVEILAVNPFLMYLCVIPQVSPLFPTMEIET